MRRITPQQTLFLLNRKKERDAEIKSNREWNELYDEACRYAEYFNDTLKSYDVGGFYIVNVDAVNDGRWAWEAERELLKSYLNKIRQYKNLGGDTSDILDYKDIDEYLDELKDNI